MTSLIAKTLTTKPHKLLALIFLLLASVSGLSAQQNFGGVRGEVKDVQGASIPKATVTLTNEGTKVSRSVVTNDAGIYVFGGVDPGTYKVTISMPGFKSYDSAGNVVSLGVISTVDAALQIGATTETVEVTADSLVLNTSSASGGQLYSAQQVQDLPLLGRNPFMLEAFDANVVLLGDPRYVRAEDQTGSSQVSLAGAPSNSNSYVVDGIPISTSSGGVTFIPTVESVESAKIQTNTYDAEIGRSGGGIFNSTLKVGSTQYHGVLYGETRQTGWSSNLWYDTIYTGTTTPGLNTPTPSDTTYIYEGGIGGPLFPNWLKKPHWLDNTFFWIDEAGYRQGQPLSGVTTSYYTPAAAERNGDFSAYAPANGSLTSCTGTTGAAGGACFVVYDPTTSPRATFLTETGKNVIPAADINKIGLYTANQFPTPTATSLYGAGANFTNNGISFKSRDDTYSGKLEHTFFPWWTSSISYIHSAIQEPSGNPLIVQYANSTKLLRYTDATAINNTFVINPSTLLTVAYGQNRYYSASFQYSTGFNPTTGFGGTGFSQGFASLLQSPTFPSITLASLTNSTAASIGAANGGPTVYASHNVVAVVSKTLGKQNIKAGYAFRAFNVYSNPTSGGNGSFTFNGQYSDSTGASNSNSPGSIADLIMGIPDAATLTLNTGSFTNDIHYNSLFAQDDVRLTDKLTVNVGLRYEYELGQYEKNNRYNVGFDQGVTSTYTGVNGPVTVVGGVDFAGVNGSPTHCCANSHTKFSPRIGVSYAPIKDTVIHAGFGIFYSPVGIAAATAGYSQTTTLAQSNATGAVAAGPNAYLTNPFPAGVLLPTGSTLGPLTNIGSSFTGSSTYTFTTGLQSYRKHFPLVEQYSLDVQHLFPKDVLVKIGYYGAHARNFANYANINQIPDAVLAQYAPGGAKAGTNLATKVANPYYATTIGGLPATGVVSTSTVAQGQLLLPFPQFGSVYELVSTGYSNYNSLVVKAEKRMSKGLTVLATYTWSANWDNIYSTGSQVYSPPAGPQDFYNPRAEYARSINSIPNRYTAAVTYELPVGRGKKYLGSANRFVDELVGGWSVNDEWVIQNGNPLSIVQTDFSSSTYGTTGVGGTQQRPNLAGSIYSACQAGHPQGHLGNYGTGLTRAPYVNPLAFTPAAPYTYGNTPRSLPCRNPGYDNTNLAVFKNFSITERVKFQFRAEALNAFNTPLFAEPSNTLGLTATGVNSVPTINGYTTSSPNQGAQSLGNVTTTLGFARIIQLGGRLSF
jgi:hypothetical protein